MNSRTKKDVTFDDAAHLVVLMQSASVNDLRIDLGSQIKEHER